MQGFLYVDQKEYERAEAALQKSLEIQRSAVVLNDLALVAYHLERHADAERMAREALQEDMKLASAWDTLGLALIERAQVDKAERAFKESLRLSRSSGEVFVHMAELQKTKGNKQAALEYVKGAEERRQGLSSEYQKRLATLRIDVARM
jgi:tetratricopeptide (TPR) repeat protein